MAENPLFGFRFHPKEEVLTQILTHTVTGNSSSYNGCIRIINLYGDKEPWEIFGECKEKELYFFTKLIKKNNKNGSRFVRTIGKGKWLEKQVSQPLYNYRNQVIGMKRNFRYVGCKKKSVDDEENKVTWLMKEYSLVETLMRHAKDEYQDYVLCVIKKKGSKKESAMTFDDHGNYDRGLVLDDLLAYSNPPGTIKSNYLPIVNMEAIPSSTPDPMGQAAQTQSRLGYVCDDNFNTRREEKTVSSLAPVEQNIAEKGSDPYLNAPVLCYDDFDESCFGPLDFAEVGDDLYFSWDDFFPETPADKPIEE